MNKNLYFDGRQLKNYLIGFASLFSEIPYKDRVGKIKTVPIHYGSPSDVISYLENDVDNEATANRNRLKDISVPMFSFRMTGIERHPEKRRSPHNTMTVDLRPMGYNIGYVTMWPAPYRFTMELICWASSDYQAFEISEQIIPYFNSPQQVIIEPLPRCRVSATEIFLDNIEIDTEPESQKYSALITMSFSLTGYILTQPKIWSTNLQFELSMLDTKSDTIITDGNDYSVGHEIRDLNIPQTSLLPKEDKLSGIEGFILNTPILLSEYGEKLDWYKILVENDRIDENGVVIDTTELTIDYKGNEKIFYPSTIQFVADEMDEVRYLLKNEKLESFLSTLSIEGALKVLNDLIKDESETISVYSILLDNNIVTKGFNNTKIHISNSEKLSLFGSLSVDIEDILERLRLYLAASQTIKLSESIIKAKYGFVCEPCVFFYENNIPYENLNDDLKSYISPTYLEDNKLLEQLSFDVKFDESNNLIIITEPNISGKLILETISGINISDFSTDVTKKIIISSNNFDFNDAFGLVLKVDDKKTIIYGVVARNFAEDIDIPMFDYKIFGLSELYNIGLNSDGNEVSFELDTNYYKMFEYCNLFESKFTELDTYIISILLYKILQKDLYESVNVLEIIKNKYQMIYDDIIEKANIGICLIQKLNIFIDVDNIVPFTNKEIADSQQTVVDGSADEDYTSFAQAIAYDNDGKPIYDVNKDGFINKDDLDLLNSNVDNPDEYDYELIYGVWYKRYKVEDMTEETLQHIMHSLKVILYIIEKTDYTEFYDYLFLINKGLISDKFALFSNVEGYEDKLVEIETLGYDTNVLDDKLLFLRMFVEALRCIIVDDAKYIIYRIPTMNEVVKKFLLTTEGFNIDNIVKGKYIELYLNSFDETHRLDKEFEIRELLDQPMGKYLDYAYEFNLLLRDISNSVLFTESLEADTQWLDETLPEVKQKIEDKYIQP